MTIRELFACSALIAVSLAAPADELTGEIAISLRDVSVSGYRSKYQEDINLDDGMRLANLSFLYRSDGSNPLTPDKVSFDARNLGGDPYENMRLVIRKIGAYSFKAERRRSAWFYDDIIVLPQDASINGSTGGDFHRFDTERVRDDIALSINLNERANLTLGFDRNARTGHSTTTLDVSRDEFELDRPIDELTENLRLGFDYRWKNTRVSFEERVHDYENNTEMFLPGFSVGGDPSDLTTLDFYFLNAPYSTSGNDHVVRVDSQPTNRLSLSMLALVGDMDLETRIDERLQGISFNGSPLQSAESGDGRIARDTAAFDANTEYSLSPQLDLIAGVRVYQLDQSGNVTFNDVEGGLGEWEIENRAFDIGFAWQTTDSLLVSAGWQTQDRDVESRKTQVGTPARLVTDKSDADGLFVNVDYRPNKRLHINARLNDQSRDDPYSLAAPSELTRFRLRANYLAANGVRVSASHSRSDRENDFGQWSAATRQSTLRVSRLIAGFRMSIGGTLIDSSQDFTRLVSGGTRQDTFDVAYAADTRYADASLSWAANERWTVGGYWRRYDNSGSFNVSRDDWRSFIDVNLPRNYSLSISFRRVDYEEGGIEYYDAEIVEAVLRLRL